MKDQLILKPPLVALIETYADGDPAVVNSLTERILVATRGPAPKSFAEVVADLRTLVGSDVRLAAEVSASAHGRIADEAASDARGSVTEAPGPPFEDVHGSREEASIERKPTASKATSSSECVACDDDVAVFSGRVLPAESPPETAEQLCSVAPEYSSLGSQDNTPAQNEVTSQIDAATESTSPVELSDIDGPATPVVERTIEGETGLSESTTILVDDRVRIVSPEVAEIPSLESVLELSIAGDERVPEPTDVLSTESQPEGREGQVTNGLPADAPQAFWREDPLPSAVSLSAESRAAAAVQEGGRTEAPREELLPSLVYGGHDQPVAAATVSFSQFKRQVVAGETSAAECEQIAAALPDLVIPEGAQPERSQPAANGGISRNSRFQLDDVAELPQNGGRGSAAPGGTSAIRPGRKWMIRGGGGIVAGVAVVLCVAGLRSLEIWPVMSGWFPAPGGGTANDLQVISSTTSDPTIQAGVGQRKNSEGDRTAASKVEPVAGPNTAHETQASNGDQLKAAVVSPGLDLAGSSQSQTSELNAHERVAEPPHVASPVPRGVAPPVQAALESIPAPSDTRAVTSSPAQLAGPVAPPAQAAPESIPAPSDTKAATPSSAPLPGGVAPPVQAALQSTPAPPDTNAATSSAAPLPRGVAPPVQAALEPPSAPPNTKAATSSPAAELFLQRGDQLLAQGDIIPARQFFERAVEGGDARAAFRLAKSYDPLYLRRVGVRGVAGDPTRAKQWYENAVASGSDEAAMALFQLKTVYP